VSAFVLAAVVMLIAMVPSLLVIARGEVMEAMAGYEAISSIAVMVLVLLSEGFRRPAEFELPVLLAALLFGSGLVFVRFLEQGV
jgi:multisubunit Na+/H+ antiporter MnhF subunit